MLHVSCAASLAAAGLHKYADSFASSGLAVLVFDYRSFGGSEGEPRQWVSPARHTADWAAAVRFVQVCVKKLCASGKTLAVTLRDKRLP